MCKAAAPYLRETKGAIVNIGSISGVRAGRGSIPYGVSKAALHHMTKGLAIALAPDVRVNAVAPGWIDTPRTEGYDKAPIAAVTPLERTGKAEEIAAAVSFLVDSRFTTGEVIVVDGGIVL
jgi:ketoreductase RED2